MKITDPYKLYALCRPLFDKHPTSEPAIHLTAGEFPWWRQVCDGHTHNIGGAAAYAIIEAHLTKWLATKYPYTIYSPEHSVFSKWEIGKPIDVRNAHAVVMMARENTLLEALVTAGMQIP